MFQIEDIRCIKNVKRDGGEAWAYMEYSVGDVFDLRFPNNPVWFPGNYSRPSLGQLMVLFQTITNPQVGLPATYITHLVTPVDEFASQDDDPIYPYKRLVCGRQGRTSISRTT